MRIIIHIKGTRVARQYVSTEARRKQIISVAADLMAQKGFYATTMPDIATAAGLSVGGLYRHFASKADLIVALVAEDADDLVRQLDRLSETELPAQRLASLVQGQLQQFAQPYALPLRAEILAAASRDPAIADATYRHDARWNETFKDLISAAAAPGSLGDRAPDRAVELLATVIDGIATRSAISGKIDPLQAQMIADVLHLILKAGASSDG